MHFRNVSRTLPNILSAERTLLLKTEPIQSHSPLSGEADVCQGRCIESFRCILFDIRPVHGLLGGVDAGFETKGENTTDCVTRSHALNPNSTQKHLTLRPSEFHAASGIQPERWEDTEKNVDRKPNCLVLVYAASGTDPYLGFQEALIPLLKQHWVI